MMLPVPIAKVFHQGEILDYSGIGYSIDHLGVYKHGKLLAPGNSTVKLTCKRGIRTHFGKLRLYHAVINPLPDAEIERASGLRAVDYTFPSNDPRRYAYETAADRDQLLAANELALPDIWKPVVYMNHSTDFSNYEIHGKTGHIRRISENPLKPNKTLSPTSRGQVRLYGPRSGGGGSNQTNVYLHVAYMWTFKAAERRPDQTEVDHIRGHLDNSPQNLRWASSTENKLYIFTSQIKKSTYHRAPETMDLSGLKQFMQTNIWCGYVRLKPEDPALYVMYNTRTGTYQGIGDFGVTARLPYPMIKIGAKSYLVHCVVAAAEGIITYGDMSERDVVVMHLDNDKTNFIPENLARGSPSTNNYARHENPATTGRKRVRAVMECGKTIEFDSRTAAANAVGGRSQGISEAIRGKYRHRGVYWEDVCCIQATYTSALKKDVQEDPYTFPRGFVSADEFVG